MASESRKKPFGAWGLALLLLALGAAGGIAADRLVLCAPPRGGRSGPPSPEVIVQRLTRRLDLDDAQARAIAPIVEARWRALARLFERVDPEAEAIRRDANERIRALLDAGQRERFDAHVAASERRRAEMRRRLERTEGPSEGSGAPDRPGP
jgi:hypothetical protein